MATQELNHAQNFKDMGETVYAEISKTYMPEDTAEHWEHCLHKYADKSARIKIMLSMWGIIMTFKDSIPLAKQLAENQLSRGFDTEAF